MTRKECLDAAAKAVLTDRAREYGHPEDCFGLIAALWSRYTERDISSADVAVMMILLKIARIEGNPRHADSWVDIAGYAACGAECATGMSGCERVGGVDYGAGLGRIVRVKTEEDIPPDGEPLRARRHTGEDDVRRLTKMDSSITINLNSEEHEQMTVDGKLLFSLIDRLAKAEAKHPDFADGIYQGVGVIGEEYGELCQALNKGEGEERVMDEALDLLCVVWRFCRGDWRQGK